MEHQDGGIIKEGDLDILRVLTEVGGQRTKDSGCTPSVIILGIPRRDIK